MAVQTPDRILTAAEAADLLKVSLDGLYDLCQRDRRLPFARLGRRLRFSESALRKFIADGGSQAKGR